MKQINYMLQQFVTCIYKRNIIIKINVIHIIRQKEKELFMMMETI